MNDGPRRTLTVSTAERGYSAAKSGCAQYAAFEAAVPGLEVGTMRNPLAAGQPAARASGRNLLAVPKPFCVRGLRIIAVESLNSP